MPTESAESLAYTFPVLQLPVTSSAYFIYRTQLAIISHEIVTQLYCAATIKQKWSDVQATIHRIDHRLKAWRDNLPKEFDITFDTFDEPDWNDPYILPRTGLAMLYNSSRMILFRPCLCRFEGRLNNQSIKSQDFNKEGVETCIGSARQMISLVSWSARSVSKLYAIPPWWNTLHYLCEALSVLMLELAFQSEHLPEEKPWILDDAKKAVRWLIMMAEQSVSARKAWEIFDSLIRLVAPTIKYSVFDMPTEAPIPPGYNWRRFKLNDDPIYQQPLTPPLPPIQSQFQLPSEHQTLYQAPIPWQDPQQPPPQNLQPSLLNNPPTSYPPSYEQLASNPLDQTTAIQRFQNIGNVHGHYDEPWQHFFNLPDLPGFGGGEDEAFAQNLYQGAAGMGFGGQGNEGDDGGPSGSTGAGSQASGMADERRYYY